MTGLDPAVRDLLVAVEDLDQRLRGIGNRERSMALAYLAGCLRGVVGGTTSLQAATATVAAYQPDREEVTADAR